MAPIAVGEESEEPESTEEFRNPLEGVLEETVEGYLSEHRLVGGPTDVETDLDTAFPKTDAVFPGLIPRSWFKFKEDLYEKHGIKLAVSYQALFQKASDVLTPA